ncbi:PTS sugar transporter subunit IIC [Priestia taiwanensis]|uniref:Permease IIC component n=1 Tax=Priestia taiwanensis TaxID=1347902 RepID=A0A917AYK6_9BACI|nr:PTS sugar transporter subunit IIC [Priestia taiwanensis]MBM7364429.1 PTS system cellobiose-specific IIC component [Priestia taiwanensis]GGE81524.1 permease IIC component [Priestia taiwanensis]
MDKMIQFLEKYFIPVAGKIGAQRHLVAIRDGFMVIMPLIIAGALAVLFNNFPIDGWPKWLADNGYNAIAGNIWTGSFAIMGLLIAGTVAYNLAKGYGVDGMSAAALSIGVFVIFSPLTGNDTFGIQFSYLGAQGLFVALFVAIFVTEIFRFLIQKNFTIKMPDGVPPAVARSFAALLPGMAVLLIAGLAQYFIATSGGNVFTWVFTTIQQPLQGFGDSLPALLLIAFLNHFLWFFGLHGSNILGGLIDPIYLPLIEENIKVFGETGNAADVPNLVTKQLLDAFVYMGGSGTTLALLIAVLIFAKSNQARSVGKLATPSGLFNINEPVMFGFPIVLNPMMLVPFILTPLVLSLTSYFAISWGWVSKTVAIAPWTAPPIMSGWIVTGGDVMGIVLQVVNLAIAVLLYVPFVIAADKQMQRAEATAQKTGA